MKAAIAHALYDTFHTARLSEHPEDFAEYEGHAANLVKWLGVHGLILVASGMEAPSGGETVKQGSTEGDSPVANGETPPPSDLSTDKDG